ncbi:MAG: DUF11 domain-containing protein [Ardenticatenales bacterium]|nr:DUF11 domain-containing protein [Ardenticatenales bacterium]
MDGRRGRHRPTRWRIARGLATALIVGLSALAYGGASLWATSSARRGAQAQANAAAAIAQTNAALPLRAQRAAAAGSVSLYFPITLRAHSLTASLRVRLEGGRLDVLGTPGKDDVILRLDPSGKTVEVDDRTNGAGTNHRFDLDDVKSFNVDLGAGDDWVIFDDANGSLAGLRAITLDAGDGDNVAMASTGSLTPAEIAALPVVLPGVIANLRALDQTADALTARAEKLEQSASAFAATEGMTLTLAAERFAAEAQEKVFGPSDALSTSLASDGLEISDRFGRAGDAVIQARMAVTDRLDTFRVRNGEDFSQTLKLLTDEAIAKGEDDAAVEDVVGRIEALSDAFVAAAESQARQGEADIAPPVAALDGLAAELEQRNDAVVRRVGELEAMANALSERFERDFGGDRLDAEAAKIEREAEAINRDADLLGEQVEAALAEVDGLFKPPSGNTRDAVAVSGGWVTATGQLQATPPAPTSGCSVATHLISGSGFLIGTWNWSTTNFNDYMIGTGSASSADFLFGLDGDDEMHGGVGNDWMFGNGGHDCVFGEADNDRMFGDLLLWLGGSAGKDRMDGGDGTDWMFGNANDDTMNGGAGSDRVFGNADADTIHGGDGTDWLSGNSGGDTLNGDASYDLVFGNGEVDTLYGGDGGDFMAGGGEVGSGDNMYGNAGNDFMFGGAGMEYMEGNDGTDVLSGGTANDHIVGNDGTDFLSGGPDDDTMAGLAGTDFMSGDAGADTLNGGGGSDLMWGRAGADGMRGDFNGSGNDWMFGNEGPDTMGGDAGADFMWGNADADTMNGDAGTDLMSGNDGDDTMYGGDGTDFMWGGDGCDQMHGGNGVDFMWGGAGVDTMWGDAGMDFLWGGDDDDTMYGGTGMDFLWGNTGNDAMWGDDGSDFLWGNDGDDCMTGGAGNDFLWGNAGNDTLHGEGGTDLLWGNDGDDHLYGGAGTDLLWGGIGDDELCGNDGNDFLWGGDGNDVLHGDAGNDLLWGNAGGDFLYGGAGNDFLWGNQGWDKLCGNDGNDFLWGNEDGDTMDGGVGGDFTWGNDGADTMWGGTGSDKMWGGADDDNMAGNAATDWMWGNDGADTMWGGTGTDWMWGNAGADIMNGGDPTGLLGDFVWGNGGNNTVNPNGPNDPPFPAPDCSSICVPKVCNRTMCKDAAPAACDLAITKTIKPNPPVSGQQATFILTVTNLGAAPCAGPITVTDVLPPGFTFVGVQAGSGTCSVTGTTVTCTWPGPVPAGSLPTVLITGNVTTPSGATLHNCATVSSPNDGNAANNTSCVDIPVLGAPNPTMPAETATSIPAPTETPTSRPANTATPTSTRSPTSTPTATSTPSMTPRPTSTATAPRPTPGCAPRPASMAAWWALDELSGTTVRDSIGDNHGVAEGGASVLNQAKVAAGRSFDAGRVVMPDAPSLDAGDGDFSIAVWVNPSTDAPLQPIVTKLYAPADAPLGYAFTLERLEPTFTMSNEGSSLRVTDHLTMPARVGYWSLLAVTVQRGSRTGGTLFRNGVPYHTFDTTGLVGAVDTPADLHVGEEPRLGRGGAQHFFGGGIDELQIFHRALTPDEVRSIYVAGSYGTCDKPPAPTPTARPRPTTPSDPLSGWMRGAGGESTFGPRRLGTVRVPQ